MWRKDIQAISGWISTFALAPSFLHSPPPFIVFARLFCHIIVAAARPPPARARDNSAAAAHTEPTGDF